MSLPTPRTPDPMSAPPLRWGLIGPGWIAEAFVEAIHNHTRSRIVAVGSRSAERAGAFAQRIGAARSYGSYAQLVADREVDAVYVATPHSEHLSGAMLAIHAGKPVLVEKAFTRNAGEARQVLDAARAAGVAVMEAMWTRFLPSTDIVRQLLAAGALGEIEALFADHGQWFAEDPHFRLFDPSQAGGAMLDLGVYPVSFSHLALGAPAKIQAAGTSAFTGVDRQISGLLSGYAAHPGAHSLVNTTLAARTPTVALISGVEARIEIPGAFYAPQQIRVISRDGSVEESAPPVIAGHLGLCHEAAHFSRMIADGRTESELLPWSETLAVMETMDELRRQVGALLPGETL
ncbi:Predicted dehydrogenase [Tessaracoccus bendigoensis DSM 12906]|uniref:Predicted dehydrogenase n=1 Tax=Tessaracoccus bendigoensis DSM 12906 TaxID=1123357 RepID=A0A1M6HL28_9ACTN|nr:Gfo/Idh/MocA family oxidoreductase [Tessaracoccus bendigoensis]SHJ22908.1 Predicted dehydrogenase [Tessaracoccus bendigoensis DSM 12906]